MTAAAAESTALVVVPEPELPEPVYSGADMVKAFKAYRELQAALDHEMPDAIIKLDGKPFRRKQFWRGLGVAFSLNVECIEDVREVYGVLEDGSENFGYRVTYRASKGSRSAVGDGSCTAAEKQRGRMRATEHNVRSHAHTRAYNRAISNLVAFGEISAEEVDDEPEPTPMPKPKAKPAAAAAPDKPTPVSIPTDAVTITRLDPPWKDTKSSAKAFLFHSGMAPNDVGLPIYQDPVKTTAEACLRSKALVRLEIVTSASSGRPYVKAIVKVEDDDTPFLS